MYWFPVECHSYLYGSPGLSAFFAEKSRCSRIITNLYCMGMRKLEAVCMLYHRATHNNNWIFISFSAIIWSISLGFSQLFLTLLIVFVCSGFFPLDLSRPKWFLLSHMLLLSLRRLSLRFTTCFDSDQNRIMIKNKF